MFAACDANGDGIVDHDEYVGEGDALTRQRLSRAAAYSQADIDDDGVLGLAEYQFAQLLLHQERMESKYAQADGWLPEGFRDGLEGVFAELHETSRGKIWLRDVSLLLQRFLEQDKFEEREAQRLKQMFDWADISKDGMLNLNELDMLHLVMRDFMIEVFLLESLISHVWDERVEAMSYDEQVSHVIFLSVLKDGDGDEDGQLDVAEFSAGVLSVFADSEDEYPFYTGQIQTLFPTFDKNGDGALNPAEALALIDDLYWWRSV